MSQSQVLAALDSMRVEHSAYDRATRTVVAKFADRRAWQIVRRSILFKFNFDSADVLTSHSASEGFAGP